MRLTINNSILYIELLSKGTFNQVYVEPIEIFSFVMIKQTNKVILVHNHPKGDITPTVTDRKNRPVISHW